MKRHSTRGRGRQVLLAAVVAASLLSLGAAPAGADTRDAGDAGAADSVVPLPGHAHNDYEHDRPLHDALEHGFTSVEADVFLLPGLAPGELLIGHDPWDLTPERTLESVYLEPLAERVAELGAVYPGHDEPILLLIDVKTEAESTHALIEETLAGYADILTSYADGEVIPGAVTAVVSGNRDTETMAAADQRLTFLDTRAVSDEWVTDAALAPLVSDNYTNLFTWDGTGEMPPAQRALLRGLADAAHTNGQTLRLWATPEPVDTPVAQVHAIWEELLDAGVDYVNTDDLAGFQEFALARES